MVTEDGLILVAAAQLVAAEARRSGMDLDRMTQKTMDTFKKLRAELTKPENV